MKVLKIEPGKKPEVKEIENSLESLQSEVLGDIEAYYPFVDNSCYISLKGTKQRKCNICQTKYSLGSKSGFYFDN